MSFQNLPLLLRVSIRKQQNDLITGGPLCTLLLLLGGQIGTVTKPIHFLCHSLQIVLKLNYIEHCCKKVIRTSTKKLGPFGKARHCATTQEVLTLTVFSSRFLNTQYLQSFKQFQFLFPQNYLQKLATTMKERSFTESDLQYRIHFHEKGDDCRIIQILIQKSLLNCVYIHRLRYTTHMVTNKNEYP